MCLMETVAVRCVGSGQTCPPYIARVVSVWESKTHDGPILLCCRKAQCLLLCQAQVPCTLQGFYFLFLFFPECFPKPQKGIRPAASFIRCTSSGRSPAACTGGGPMLSQALMLTIRWGLFWAARPVLCFRSTLEWLLLPPK